MSLKTLFAKFLLLNLVQGILALVVFSAPRSEEAVLFGLSKERWIVFAGMAAILAGIGVAYAAVRRERWNEYPAGKFINKYFWALALLALGWVAGGWLVGLKLLGEKSIFIIKLWPVLAWGELLAVEALWALLRLPEEYRPAFKISPGFFRQKEAPIGYALIALAGGFGILIRYYGGFVDEGDHLATGYLMSQGWTLYTDVFSHHPPLVYYWISALIRVFGPDIGVLRASLVFLWMAVFGVTAYYTKQYLTFGILAVLWAGVSHFYLANLLTYQAFSGIFLVACSGLVLFYRSGKPGEKGYFACLGLFFALTLLSNPQMIWPAAFLLLGFLVYLFTQKIEFKNTIRNILILAAAGAAPLLVYALGLWYSHSVSAAVYSMWIFNSQIYSKYTGAGLNPLSSFWVHFRNGLDILSFVQKGSFSFEKIDQWVFGGLVYRLAILALTLTWLVAKKSIRVLFFYAACATLFPRAVDGFQVAPFVLLALLAIGIMITNNPWSSEIQKAPFWRPTPYTFVVRGFFILAALTLAGTIYVHQFLRTPELTYEFNFAKNEASARNLQTYECGVTSTRYLIYPINPFMYFVLDRLPASKYIFMTPWVAEVGQQEMLAQLQSEPYAVVYVGKDQVIWGHPVKDYLSDLFSYLQAAYTEVAPDTWRSPALQKICGE